MARPERTDDTALTAWAKEHLMYEVDTMVYALEKLDAEPTGWEANVALEAFAVHARNLLEFLWGKPNHNFDNDAFAFDFSADWKGRRGAIPTHLAEVESRKRFGKEVFHLTYDRISGVDDRKVWLCGEMAVEIGTALKLFAKLARATALDDDTRARLAAVAVEVKGDDGEPTQGILRLDLLRSVTAATSMPATQLKGGTINPRNVNPGGV